MTLYVDTSVLVSAFANEAASDRARAWLDRQEPLELAISHWVVAEFSAALSVKLRTGALNSGQRDAALKLFGAVTRRSFTLLPVDSGHFQAAARLADGYAPGLRAGDALHLALVLSHGATLCTLDRRLSIAADAFGGNVDLV